MSITPVKLPAELLYVIVPDGLPTRVLLLSKTVTLSVRVGCDGDGLLKDVLVGFALSPYFPISSKKMVKANLVVFGIEHTPLTQLLHPPPAPLQELSEVQVVPQAGGVWHVFVPGSQTEHPPVAPEHVLLVPVPQVDPQAGTGVVVGVEVRVGVAGKHDASTV